MKKLLRLILKILVTPLVLPFMIMMILIGFGAMFVDWLYEKDDFDKRSTKSTHKDFVDMFKNWFTTV